MTQIDVWRTVLLKRRSSTTPIPLKRVLERNDTGTWGDDPTGEDDDLVLRSTDIKVDGTWSLTDPARRSLGPNERRATRLEVGDIVVVKSSGSETHIGKAALVGEDVAALRPSFSNFTQRLRPRDRRASRYLWYLLNSSFAREQFSWLGTSTTGLRNLSASLIGSLWHPGLSIAEQQAIVKMLDRETARIDDLMSRKREMRDKLNLRRRALIDAVLGRYEGGARVKNAVRMITSGPRGWSEHFNEEGVVFLRITNFSRNSIALILDDIIRVTPPEGPEADRTRADPGDVVVSITADIGSVGVVTDGLAGSHVSQHLALLRTDRAIAEPDWLALSLFGSQAQAQLDSARYGGTKTQLSLEDVAEVRIPLPSPSEQRSVLAEWRAKDAATQAAIQRFDEQLNLLAEHRQALITAAVTDQMNSLDAQVSDSGT